jgi:hypothetical protein
MFNDYPRSLLSANHFMVSNLKFVYFKWLYQSIQMPDAIVLIQLYLNSK